MRAAFHPSTAQPKGALGLRRHHEHLERGWGGDKDPLDPKWKQIPSCTPVTLDGSVSPQDHPNPGLVASGNTVLVPPLLTGDALVSARGEETHGCYKLYCLYCHRTSSGLRDPGQMDTTRRKEQGPGKTRGTRRRLDLRKGSLKHLGSLSFRKAPPGLSHGKTREETEVCRRGDREA